MQFGGFDIMIFSEVWDKVISWDWFCFCFNCKFLTMLFFSFTDVKVSHFDVMINAKVRHEVVSWGSCWLIERCVQLLTKCLLRFFNIRLSSYDIISISAKVWNRVVNWPRWFLPGLSKLLFVPWGLSLSWSVCDFRCFGIFRKECKGDNADRYRFKHVN